jgi:hypothetical protein
VNAPVSEAELAHMALLMARAGLRALSFRVLSVLSLLMVAGLFAWAMYAGTTLHLIIAGTFAVLVFIPILWRESRTREPDA